MANSPAIIEYSDGELLVKLPITSHTGRVRVKERTSHEVFGHPFSTRSKELNKNCYIEWQISYDTSDENQDGVIKEISYTRDNVRRYGFELSSLLFLAVKHNVVGKEILAEILQYAKQVNDNEYLDVVTKISRNFKGEKILSGMNFHKFTDTYEAYLVIKESYVIEAIVKHKQRAVGYQPMVYINLPISKFEENVVGRKAMAKEYISYCVNEGKNNFLQDCLKVFILTSARHRVDIRNILLAIQQLID